MKRRQLVKWLMLIAVALVATMASADVPRSHTYYYSLTRLEWEAKMQMQEQDEREKKIHHYFKEMGVPMYLLVLLSPLVFGVLAGSCLYRWIRIRKRKYFVAMVLAFLLLLPCMYLCSSLLKSILSPLLAASTSNAILQNGNRIDVGHDVNITVEPEPGETYEQYLERVGNIIIPQGNVVGVGK